MPPSGSLLSLRTPSAGARAGVPPAAKMSQPWWKWKAPAHRGVSQSSLKLAGPAAGNRPNPMIAACCSLSPASTSGCRAASNLAVEFGGVRLTPLMMAAAPAGSVCGVVGSCPSPSPPSVVVVVDELDVEVELGELDREVVVVVEPVSVGFTSVDEVVLELFGAVVEVVDPSVVVVVDGSMGLTSPRAGRTPP